MKEISKILQNIDEKKLSPKELDDLLWTPVMFSTYGLNAEVVGDGWHFGWINDIKDQKNLGVNIMPGGPESKNIYPKIIVKFEDFKVTPNHAFPKGALDIKKTLQG